MLDLFGKTSYNRSACMDEVYELTAKTPEELLTEQLIILNTLTEAVREVVEASSLDIDPESYFIWMYSVEPFPEA